MSFIPNDPTVSQTIGSFTVNINGFPLNGSITYDAPVGASPGKIMVGLHGSTDLKAAAADVFGVDVTDISVSGSGLDEDCFLDLIPSVDVTDISVSASGLDEDCFLDLIPSGSPK